MTTREPLQIVEIDIDFCTRTYGTAPCTASLGSTGVRKCYNTFFTCQDQGNYNAGTLTLRFSKNQIGLPKGQTIFPALQSVSTNPAKITLGAVDERLGTLGKRARITVNLKDFKYSDALTDKYAAGRRDGTAQTDEGGYEPQDRGTFFGKLRRRFPYYNKRALRVKNGHVGDSLAAMDTAHYVITEWEGPDLDGNVTITAKDVLDLADNDKAKCPKPSNGKLSEGITDSYTGAVTLKPATVGDEYASSGRAAIGSEIVSFTRSGDVVTITARGLDGTDASSHSEDDTFQQCYRAEAAKAQDVIQEILEDFADVPSGYITIGDWNAEVDVWLASLRLTRTIPKPVGVTTLLGELADFGILLWWNETTQKISLRVNRPPGYDETFESLSDDDTIIEGSLGVKDLHDQRLSQTWFYHGQIDSAGSVSDPENYKRLFVASDLQAESDNEYDQSRIREFFSPWLGDGDDVVAAAVSNRLTDRYRDTPREITFLADVKDKTRLELAQLIRATTRAMQDETGQNRAMDMQVTAAEETDPGNRLRITAQSYEFTGRYGFITENARPDYDASSAAQIEKGTYIVDESTLLFPDGTGPYVIF